MTDEVNETPDVPEMAPQPLDMKTPPAAEETAAVEDSAAEGTSLAAGLTLGEATEESDEEAAAVAVPQLVRGHIDRFGVAWGTGRRKTSVARVRVREGNGTIKINGRELDEYFPTERDRATVVAPLGATEMSKSVDVLVNVKGGGTTGQAGAIMLGVARALQAMQPELHEALSSGHYLTRDGRMVERKKYGFKKARKSFQFSKR